MVHCLQQCVLLLLLLLLLLLELQLLAALLQGVYRLRPLLPLLLLPHAAVWHQA
jgi:hypothetical protein